MRFLCIPAILRAWERRMKPGEKHLTPCDKQCYNIKLSGQNSEKSSLDFAGFVEIFHRFLLTFSEKRV